MYVCMYVMIVYRVTRIIQIAWNISLKGVNAGSSAGT